MTDPLVDARAQIDEVDAELVALLARRSRIVADLWAWKRAHGVPERDLDRERDALARVAGRAAAAGLDPAAVREVFERVIGRPLR